MNNEEFVNSINLKALMEIENSLLILSTKKNQCDIAKQCKNYLSVIAEENLDGVEV